MIIIPSIDIKNGSCIRLMQGDFKRVTEYFLNLKDVAAKFSCNGASVLHVVDLDGAKSGYIQQISTIKSIRSAFKKNIQVGGGVRSTNDIEALLALGVDRVVIGSSAVLDIELTTEWLEKYGEDKIVLALDFYFDNGEPYVFIKGWQEKTRFTVWDMLKIYPKLKYLLCTDISKDGMQLGPSFKFYADIKAKYPGLIFQASGGVSSLQDLIKLQDLNIDAAIVGRAIYENKFDFKEALTCLK